MTVLVEVVMVVVVIVVGIVVLHVLILSVQPFGECVQQQGVEGAYVHGIHPSRNGSGTRARPMATTRADADTMMMIVITTPLLINLTPPFPLLVVLFFVIVHSHQQFHHVHSTRPHGKM